jgi:hypothetical protein
MLAGTEAEPRLASGETGRRPFIEILVALRR